MLVPVMVPVTSLDKAEFFAAKKENDEIVFVLELDAAVVPTVCTTAASSLGLHPKRVRDKMTKPNNSFFIVPKFL